MNCIKSASTKSRYNTFLSPFWLATVYVINAQPQPQWFQVGHENTHTHTQTHNIYIEKKKSVCIFKRNHNLSFKTVLVLLVFADMRDYFGLWLVGAFTSQRMMSLMSLLTADFSLQLDGWVKQEIMALLASDYYTESGSKWHRQSQMAALTWKVDRSGAAINFDYCLC